MDDDGELLQRYAASRDEAAFAAVVSRHVNLVYRSALRQGDGDPHRAEEAAQIVFTLLAQKAPDLADHPSLVGWLHTTTHFTVRDLRRREQRRREREKEAVLMNETPIDASNWDRVRPALDAALQELNERDREAILARFFEGRAFAELGRRFALSEDAARMRVERALEKLRALLSRRGITSTAAALGVMMTAEAAHAAPAGLAASLTGAALSGVGAPVAGWIAFMSTTKVAGGIAGLALALAVGVAVWQGAAHRQDQATLLEDTRALALAHARLERAQTQARSAEQVRADLERSVAQERAARTAAQRAADGAILAAPAGSPPMAAEMQAKGKEFFRAHPEARQLFVEYTRARTNHVWAPMLKSLKITPEEMEALHAAHEASAGLHFEQATGDVSIHLELSETGRLSFADLEARVRTILGEDRFGQYQDFQRISAATGVAGTLASDLFWSGAPLSPAQAEQLVEIVKQSSPDYAAGRAINLDRLDWPGVFECARAVLSDAQLAMLVAERDQATYEGMLGRAQNDARDRWKAGRMQGAKP